LLRYPDGGVARISARWDLVPFVKSSVHWGPTQSVEFREDCVETRDAAGAIQCSRPLPGAMLVAEMRRFAENVRDEESRGSLEPILNRHLAVSAIIESVYLSSRTGQPESPRRLYEAQKCEELIP
jgi:hypothetical protein